MNQPYDCWRVVVRHKRESGVMGYFRSRLMSWTEAKKVLNDYRRTGHRCYIEEDKGAVAMHIRAIREAKAVPA